MSTSSSIITIPMGPSSMVQVQYDRQIREEPTPDGMAVRYLETGRGDLSITITDKTGKRFQLSFHVVGEMRSMIDSEFSLLREE